MIVISTAVSMANGVEKSAREWEARLILDQISRRRSAPLEMTNGGGLRDNESTESL